MNHSLVNRHFLDKDATLTPFNRTAAGSMKTALDDFAKANNLKLDTFPSKLKARNMTVVTKTFHRAGLVVPVEKETDVGYRSLIETDGNAVNHLLSVVETINKIFFLANIKKMLNLLDDKPDKNTVDIVMEKLAPLITAANIGIR